MKKKPDILVVLAAILGLGIAVSSVSVASPDDKRPANLEVAQSNQ